MTKALIFLFYYYPTTQKTFSFWYIKNRR